MKYYLRHKDYRIKCDKRNESSYHVKNVFTHTVRYEFGTRSGTIATGVLHNCLAEAGIIAVVPDEIGQGKIMDIIYRDIKAGKEPNLEPFREVSQALVSQGAQVLLLGCTELSLIKRDYPIGAGYLDAMEVLARRCVLECGGRLKEEYQNLISK